MPLGVPRFEMPLGTLETCPENLEIFLGTLEILEMVLAKPFEMHLGKRVMFLGKLSFAMDPLAMLLFEMPQCL